MWSVQVLLAARTVQDYLWGPVPGQRPNKDYAAWVEVIDKRIGKLSAVRFSNPLWRVEARKRLLQVAAVALAMLEWVNQLPEDYDGTKAP